MTDKDPPPYNAVQERKVPTQLETLYERVRALDEKFTLLLLEAEKRNGQRFQAQQEAVQAALASAEKAVTKAEMSSEKRFEGMNEFRQSLADQTLTYMPRSEYTVQHQALSDRLNTITDRISELEKKIGEITSRGTGRTDTWVILATIASLVIALGSWLFHYKGG